LAARLRALNPGTNVLVEAARFEPGRTPRGDILIDATDNYPARFALNALAHRSGRVLVHGAAARWTGQASVFASGLQEGAPCYRCWVPEEPPEAEHCDEVGVVGPVTGLVGTRMALETIKLITGAGKTLTGQLWLLDLRARLAVPPDDTPLTSDPHSRQIGYDNRERALACSKI